MNNDIAYVEKDLPGVVDLVFAQDSLTERLLGSNRLKLDFLDAKTVKVRKLASTGLYDYKRGGHGESNARGAVQTTTEKFELSQERYSEIPLDELDSEDDGGTILGHQATEFIRTKVVPEFDTYRFSKLAGYTDVTFGNRIVESITSSDDILAKFNAAFKWMANLKVPTANQILYVSTSVMLMIRNSEKLVKYLSQSDYKGDVNFTIERYMGREIVEVPEDEFYTDAVMGEGVYGPAASSKLINFMIVDKESTIVIKKLDHAKVYDSKNGDAYLGFVGVLLTNLYYHDIFVSENNQAGIYCSVSQTSAVGVGSELMVKAHASTESGKSVIDMVATNPGGIMWTSLRLVTSATSPVIGAAASGTEISIGTAFTPDASHNFITAINDGKVVAVSKDFEDNLPVGA